MAYYEASVQHTEKTLMALSRMQCDLYHSEGRGKKIALSFLAIAAGFALAATPFGVILILIGYFTGTSIYRTANRTGRMLASQIRKSGMDFPASLYVFDLKKMRIFNLEGDKELDPVPYSSIDRIGEDYKAFYLFPNSDGGYMVPKKSLGGQTDEFRTFLCKKTGKKLYIKEAPYKQVFRTIREGFTGLKNRNF